jgi:mycofactocin system glycosyltransferase
MANLPLKGRFYLKPGVRLIGDAKGGVILKSVPLRAFRVNRSALKILTRCREGLSLDDKEFVESGLRHDAVLALLDRLCQTGLMEWKPPPQDGFEPRVSIIVAVYDRAREIGACLDSLLALAYPKSRYEIIVVDDGSRDGTTDVVSGYDVKLITLSENRGQSAARNRGAEAATGEIVAFIDSDCIAEPEWLADLVPYFQDSRTVLVGGYVASFYRDSMLDRYEEVNSPLNMGEDMVVGIGVDSDFYVPTCNMLVRREQYLSIGGLNEDQRVGEDVDLCWRLKAQGRRLLYVPKGRVKHKHRNRFMEGFKRRFQYGVSEPMLYRAHESAAKRYPWQPMCMLLLGVCCAGLLTREILFLPIALLILIVDSVLRKTRYEQQIGVPLTLTQVFRATVEKHFHLSFHLAHHLVRYYLLPLVVLAIIFPHIILAAVALIVFPSLVLYVEKKPRLNFGQFLFFFLSEQAFYQTGVFWGCLKLRSFRPYRLVFTSVGRRPGNGMVVKLKALIDSSRSYVNL